MNNTTFNGSHKRSCEGDQGFGDDPEESDERKISLEGHEPGVRIQWLKFIKEHHAAFHPYSPEVNNIIRSGKGISPRPYLVEPTTNTQPAASVPATAFAHNKRTKKVNSAIFYRLLLYLNAYFSYAYYYLEGRGVADEPVLEDIKWVVNSKDHNKYVGISESTQKAMIRELEEKYDVRKSEDKIHHPDFTKLANLMKDEVNLMLKNFFPEDTPVFGLLVGGLRATVFVMDLVYTKL
ncbi:hypothetical protein G6F43_011657 [Rhizopus delemar]|nr:hypothetical protein G6F43_011657 [Rhizopus delemar]